MSVAAKSIAFTAPHYGASQVGRKAVIHKSDSCRCGFNICCVPTHE